MKHFHFFRSRWLWGLLVALLLSVGHSPKAWADGARWTPYVSNITFANPYFHFDLYLLEDSGNHSFWQSVSGQKGLFYYSVSNNYGWGGQICDASNLNLIKNASGLNGIRGYDSWYSHYTNSTLNVEVGTYDPGYVSSASEYHIQMYTVNQYYIEGTKYTYTINGIWYNNDSPASASLSTTVTVNNTWPVEGTLKRTGNQTMTYTGSNNIGYSVVYDLFTKALSNATYTSRSSANGYFAKNTMAANSSNNTFTYSVDNYTAYTFYPRFQLTSSFKKDSYSFVNSGFSKILPSVKIPGYPRPKNVTTTYDKWTKKVTLNWDPELYDSSNADTNGRWHVFRRIYGDSSTQVDLGNVAYGTTTFTDMADGDYGTKYTYVVAFVPTGWTCSTENDVTGLYSSVDFALTKDFTFNNVKAEGAESSINVSWGFESMKDASASNNYTITLERRVSTDENGWQPVYEQTVRNSSTISGKYTDNDCTNKCAVYYYRLKTSALDEEWTSDEVSGSISGTSKVTNVTTTRGTYSNRVRVAWTADQYGTSPTYYNIYRRPLGSTNDAEWMEIYTTNGTATSYNYEDQTALPGEYYEYRVMSYSKCATVNAETGSTVYTDMDPMFQYSDGFSVARGVISGRVFYDTGTAVQGVRVSLVPNSDNGDALSAFYSLRVDAVGEGLAWPVTEALQNSNGAYTVQMFVRPDQITDTTNKVLMQNGTGLKVELSPDYKIVVNGTETALTLKPVSYTQVSVAYDGSNVTVYTVDDEQTLRSEVVNTTAALTDATLKLALQTEDDTQQFVGNIDDVRVWSRVLTSDDVTLYADHTMAGTESGLTAYLPMDEGISNQKTAYDYSKTGGVANGNHASMLGDVSTTVPNDNVFGLLGYTDGDGNYVIRGIPFNGEGTNYNVIPTMGVHEFSPGASSRYISASSLVHSGVDFTDVSSFKVEGYVYYDGTDYPVADCMFEVDGVTCSKEGKVLTTDENGHYEISVPIGDHSIKVSKNGHTFKYGGSYPEQYDEGANDKITFDQNISNLIFYDQTTVNVVGRVVGGSDEAEKELGMGLSKANIGQAVIELQPERNCRMNVLVETDGGLRFVNNTEEVEYARGSEFVSSAASVGAGSENAVKTIRIETDATTGEFAVKLPPIKYVVKSITLPSNPNSPLFDLPTIDATSSIVSADSAMVDDVKRKCEYTASMVAKYTAPAVFKVEQKGVEGGFFGEHQIEVPQSNGNVDVVDAYDVSGYKFGATDTKYPIFLMGNKYTYNISAYEEYTNYDDAEYPVVTKRPLEGTIVTIENALSADTEVRGAAAGNTDAGAAVSVQSNQLVLDSLGRASYVWRAGLPNITSPYTRNLTIMYGENGTENAWAGNSKPHGIILGDLPTGNNFVTKGPNKVAMILRDPAGSESMSWFEEGSVVTRSNSYTGSFTSTTDLNTVTHFGAKATVGSGIGVFVLSEAQSLCDLNVGTTIENQVNVERDSTYSVTTSERISTSDDMTLVGANGDVFIGMSSNLIYGGSRYLDIKKQSNGTYSLETGDALSVGQEFDTKFVYTQWAIENEVIPGLERVRNSMLLADTPENRAPDQEEEKYVTLVDKDDPNYGQKGSYERILPTKGSTYDMIETYNSWIDGWISQLAANEEAKVTAIKNSSKYLIENRSFSGGSEYEKSTTVQHDSTYHRNQVFQQTANIGVETGIVINSMGVTASIKENIGGGFNRDTTSVDSKIKTYGYLLKEPAGSDMLSVDIYHAPDGFGPIFVTRAGQTSAPFEDREVTKYYKPGTEISAKTMQMEIPKMEASPAIQTGVPSGRSAVVKLNLTNEGETGEDWIFELGLVKGSNTEGANIALNGQPLTNPVNIVCPAGRYITQTLTVTQTDLSVMDFTGLQLYLASPSQNDPTSILPVIADTANIEIHFQAACPDIELASSSKVVNEENVNYPLTFTAKGFDPNFATLQSVAVQRYNKEAGNWTTLKIYNKSQTDVNAEDYLPANGVLTVNENMSNLTDGEYEYRALIRCLFGSEVVEGESEHITVVKDVNRPQLIAAPSPTDGIFNYGDEISLTFNEDIQSNELTAVKNFFVRGVTNEAEVTHDVALKLNGSTAAQTESRIDLSNRDFTLETWLNWSEPGVLLQHGSSDNNLQLGVDAQGHLTVNYGGETYTSESTLTQNKWIYLMMSLQNEESEDGSTAVLNADYAYDATETNLFLNQQVPAYTGNGTLALGQSLKGMMHELTLWNTARNKAESLSQKSMTKSNYTQGLMGYWSLDEGHGTLGEDKSRSRNLNVCDNAWFINGTNYALQLDGTKTPYVEIGSISTTSSESYELEGWFRVDNTQSEVASLFATNNDNLNLQVATNGGLVLSANGTNYTVTNTDLRDNSWHHIALNVLKSTGGNATVYVDGAAVKNIASSNVPSLQAAQLLIGDHLKGAADEIRIWKGRRTADVIRNTMYTRVSADEPGLVSYYPMEITAVAGNGQLTTSATLADQASDAASRTMQSFSGALSTSSADCPPIRMAQTSNNVGFNFVASERKLLINLTDSPEKLEGCTIYFTVSGVKDKQDNYSEEITWSALIQQNQLKWNKQEVEVRKLDDMAQTFEVEVKNQGATAQNWVITNLPTWLSASSESGTLDALATQTVTFTVDASTPIGNYESTIYLTGSMDIPEPLVVKLTSTVTAPEWAVNTSGYMNTMNIIGQLQVDGKLSENSEDIVAAFRGNECVGVASPTYMKKYDSYYVMLNVYGNYDDDGSEVTFKVFDANTGTIYPLVTTENPDAIDYQSDNVVGIFSSPVIFNPEDAIEQDLALRQGYTWISIYVTPKDASLNSIFKHNAGELTRINSKTAYSEYSGDAWHGALSSIAVGNMYKVNAVTATSTSVIGKPVDPTAVEMTIGNGWNWIGYNCGNYNSLENSFADLSPNDGDIVKSQSAFSVYSDGEWVGTLNLLTPGMGYSYKSLNQATTTFHYPNVTASSRKAPRKAQAEGQFTNTQYESNMTLMAVVMNGDQVVSDAEVSVYCDGELRAASTQAVRDDVHFLTVGGNRQSGTLRFMVSVDGYDYLIGTTETFETDGVRGSLNAPLVLQMGDATGIERLNGDSNDLLFDLSGRRIENVLQKGIYIQNGVKRVVK